MQAANEVYDYLKTAGEKDAAVKALVSDMRKRYDRKDKQPADPKKPSEEKPKKPKEKDGDDITLPTE